MNGKMNSLEQVSFIKKLQFFDGKEKGEHILFVRNKDLEFSVLQDHCLDIHDFSYKGMNLSFISKNGLCSFPGEFAQVFNGGMLYTCGLDTVGGRALPVHGKIHNVPSEVDFLSATEERVVISGKARQSGLFAENLLLTRTIEAQNNTLEITTKVTNEGWKEDAYALLLHMNLGYPFLDENVRIEANVNTTLPRTPFAAENIQKCFCFETELPSTEEQVFYHKVNQGKILVVNDKLGLKLTYQYDPDMFPYFIEWKSLEAGSYALGIEPSTTTLDDGFTKKKILPQETHVYKVTITVEEA